MLLRLGPQKPYYERPVTPFSRPGANAASCQKSFRALAYSNILKLGWSTLRWCIMAPSRFECASPEEYSMKSQEVHNWLGDIISHPGMMVELESVEETCARIHYQGR